MIKTCNNCRKEFVSYRSKTIFCGQECYWKSMRGKSLDIRKYRTIERTGDYRKCLVCSRDFYAYPKSHQKYCSRKCQLAVNSIDKQKYDQSYKSELMRGENHWNWQGGISKYRDAIRSSDEHKNWRKSVFERDNYTCQNCGARCGNGKKIILNAHHIKPFCQYKELRFNVDNGITLCRECHYKEGHNNMTDKTVFNKRLEGKGDKDVNVSL